MPLIILLLVLFVPYLEFMVFLEVSESIGGWTALLLTIVTAVCGIYLIREQGFEVMRRMQKNMREGESPVEEIFHGFFLLIAGFFFLLPGFLTDSVALLLSLSPVRGWLGRQILGSVKMRFYAGEGHPDYDETITIDGEYQAEQEKPPTSLEDKNKPEI